MNRILIATLSLVLALPAWALAQGSGSSAPRRGGIAPDADAPAFAVTRTLTGKVASVDAVKNIIVVEDSKGKKYSIQLDKSTKLKADKKTEYAHKKNLSLADFETGQPVRITVLASNGMAIEVRMVKEKA